MNIQSITRNSKDTAARILSSKAFLKGLEKISEHGTTFSAAASLALSLTLRPLAIYAAPNVDKENRQYAASNSICSGLVKFGIVEAIALPVEHAVKNIDKNPEKFLKNSTIKFFSGGKSPLITSRSYKLVTQIIKLSTGILTAIPKSMLTLALIPVLMDKLFSKSAQKDKTPPQAQNSAPQSEVNFTGGFCEKLSKGLGKIIDSRPVRQFAKKYQTKDADIAKHITAGTDILLTASFAYQTEKSNKIKENRKKALIYNNVIATTLTILGGYGIDKVIKNKSGKFIEKFKALNANDPKLYKYIEGINIIRPVLIFGGIYYCILPLFSTFMVDKTDKFINKTKK